jgi:membrane peptidoglycan carboxypeptidase
VGVLFETSKKRRGRRSLGILLRLTRWTFNFMLIAAVGTFALITAGYFLVVSEYGSELSRPLPDLPENSHVYDDEGVEVAEIRGAENRETVPYRGLGEYLPQAVVAIEDRRFHEHAGVDLEGVGRAAWADLRAWGVREGGSTMTEQLMKNLFVDGEERFEVSFRRRLFQANLAFAYEQRHTKREILTAYLNTVYFGNNAYGAEAASQEYFGKSSRDLTLSEAAALAGFLHAPSTYTPPVGKEDGAGTWRRAIARRDEVLRRMRQQGMISTSEQRKAVAEPLRFSREELPGDPVNDSFLNRVRREVEDRLGDDALERGGLRIQTTLNQDLQREAVSSAEETLYLSDDPSAAIATVEPQTGAVLALAGESGDFNLALDARRQPGSSFKPFVLAAALRQGLSPETSYVSRGLSVRFEGQEFFIGNYDSIERGEITLREAMAESDNTVFVQLAADLGLNNVVETAREMGITSPMEPYPSTAIGGLGVGVSPLEMASAYATFAAGGIYREPYAAERIVERSYGRREVVYDHAISGERVLSGNQAATATDVLRGVVEEGTASRFHDLDEELGHLSAGKTGTTDDYADAWYVGYTPRLSTAVWVGYPEQRRSMESVRGEEVMGETLPLDLWSSYMAKATEGEPSLGFPEPDPNEFRVVRNIYVGGPPPDGISEDRMDLVALRAAGY